MNVTRIVKMTFKPECVEEFRKMFYQRRPFIMRVDGCLSVELLNDIDNPNVIITLSRWRTAKLLNEYRKSPFFKNTWFLVKVLFGAPAEAWTLKHDDFSKGR